MKVFKYVTHNESEIFHNHYTLLDVDQYVVRFTQGYCVGLSKTTSPRKIYYFYSNYSRKVKEEFHEDAYKMGYRRDISDEDIRGWLQGKYTHPCFDDWFNVEKQNYSSFEELQKAFNKRFKVRNRLVKIDGIIDVKWKATTIKYFDEELWQVVDKVVFDTQNTLHWSSNLEGYYRLVSPYNVDTPYGYRHLHEVIEYMDCCEEHNEMFYTRGVVQCVGRNTRSTLTQLMPLISSRSKRNQMSLNLSRWVLS